MKLFLLYRYVLFILFIVTNAVAMAQDSVTIKFMDSLKTPAPLPKTETAAVSETVVDSTESSIADSLSEVNPIDTSITSNIRQISSDSLRIIKRDKGFYYQTYLDSLLRADEARLKNREKPKEVHLPNIDLLVTIFKIVLWVIATSILFFILYKLFLGKSSLFLKNKKNIDAVINIEEKPTADQYDILLKKAEAEKNYRQAVRYLHLKALYNLSQKGCITFDTGKTNYQYTNELRQRYPALADLFAALTYKYEYIWYGEYPVSDNMYDALKQSFTEFEKEIK